jgi:hypothetical protein
MKNGFVLAFQFRHAKIRNANLEKVNCTSLFFFLPTPLFRLMQTLYLHKSCSNEDHIRVFQMKRWNKKWF